MSINLELNLLVIKTKNIEMLKDYYSLLGLEFEYQKHGSGLQHYTAQLANGIVFEIYPSLEEEYLDPSRIGFKVNNFEEIFDSLSKNHAKILKLDKAIKYLVIEDPEGRKIELIG